MGQPLWPVSRHPDTNEPLVRPRRPVKDSQAIRYTLDFVDIDTIPGFAFTTVARRVYNDSEVAWVIRDSNLSVLEQDLRVGDIILLPKNGLSLLDNGDRSTRKLLTRPTFQDAEADQF